MGMVSCFAAVPPAMIAQLKSDPSEMEALLFPDEDDDEPENLIDVDKSWHCIHFMLSGSADGGSTPLSWAILGGEEFGDDIGYGPARILLPDEVRMIATALSDISEEDFKSRYAPQAMQAADVYLSDMCVRDGDDALFYLASNYVNLNEFYRNAAFRGDGVVLWIC